MKLNFKIIYIFIILLLLSDGTYSVYIENLKERLKTGDWNLETDRSESGDIKFNDDGFIFKYSGEGIPYGEITGKYEIIKNSIKLQPEHFQTGGHQGRNLPEDIKYIKNLISIETCRIESPQSAVEFKDILQCTHSSFWDHKNLVFKNTDRVINETNSITTGKRKADVTTSVYVRSKPDVSSKPLNCSWNLTSKGIISPDDIKYSEIYVFARTKNKINIQSWENYWYYVQINKLGLADCMRIKGWIYGEFIKFID
ncbi:MAG: hypothetical protein OEV78_03465 [Spirochaetia bacterium]|nr:hypothetical protein [Spirochaetia bacterium]